MKTTSLSIIVVMMMIVGTVMGNLEGVDYLTGVAPFHKAHFESAKQSGTFQCIGSSQSIPFDQVNDNYCDCDDGSDEPGTPACNNAEFTCINKGHKSLSIPTGRVNDGICDCCDGSDEYDGTATCANECEALGAVERKKLQDKVDAFRVGVETKETWAAQGTQARKDKQARLDELQSTKQQLEKSLEEKKETRKVKELVEDLEATKRKTQWEEEQAAKKANGEPQEEMEVVTNEGEEQDNDDKPQDNQEEQQEEEKAPEYVDPGNGMDESEQQEKDKRKQGLANLLFRPFHLILEFVVDLKERFVAAWYPTEAEAARQAVDAVQNELNSVNSEIDELNKFLGLDFGPNNEFYPLYDQCYTMLTREYQWEVCPFKSSKQASSSIGTWGRWDGPSDALYSQMLYDNGDSCWQGPQRSNRVHIKCGSENKIIKVDEPQKCTYEMEFETPAACSKAHLQILEMNLENGEY